MSKLKTNPTSGRKSGDVWSVRIPAFIKLSRGDFIFLEEDASVSVFDTKSEQAKFLGISDETKNEDTERLIVVLSKGVYPFNKDKSDIRMGQALKATSNNELVPLSTEDDTTDLAVAIAYKHASSKDSIVYAKIKSCY